MKAKNILRISLFAVVLCLTLIFAVMADDLDAKIIRWDGTGNVNVAKYQLHYENMGLAVEETDGVLRVTGGSHGEDVPSTEENEVFIKLAGEDYIDLNTYPYYVIKFKTNGAYATVPSNVITQVFFMKTDTKGNKCGESSYHGCTAAPSGYDFTDMWRTYMYSFSSADDGVNKISSSTLSAGEKLWCLRLSPAKYFKNDYETMANLVLDIEYIGFFKSKADAENYINRSSVIIRFDGNEDRAAVKATNGTVTNEGTFKITLNAASGFTAKNDSLATPHFSPANDSNLPYTSFLLKDFSNVVVTAKTDVKIDGWPFYSANINGTYVFQYLNGTVSEDFKNQCFSLSDMEKDDLVTDTTKVTDPFMQFKINAAGEKDGSAEIKYIGYFKNSDDRAAFLAGAMDAANNNVKAAYKAIVNARNSVTVNTEADAESAVTAKVEELLGSDSKVAATYATDGLKVIVTLTATETYDTDKNYTATKTVGFDVKLPEEDHSAKIIRFDDNSDNVSITPSTSGNGKISTEKGVFRIDMAATDMFKEDASSQPTFTIADKDQFNLKDYPYVKIKMRTNYPATIQYYAANIEDGVTCRADIYRMPNESTNTDIADGEWHEVEFSFDKSYTDNYCFVNIGAAETAVVSKPFFQFKSLKATPDHDLFAEIEYIAYFQSKEDMKNYGKDEDKIVVTGEKLYAANNKKSLTEIADGNIFRINTSGSFTDVEVDKVFKDINGNNVDLYEYPYVKVKFKTNFAYTVQMYLDTDVRYVIYFNNSINKQYDTWHTATLSYNTNDITGYGAGNKIEFSNDGYIWTTVDTSNNRDKYDYSFPVQAGKYKFDGLKFQLKDGAQGGGYLEIAYIALYKTKEAMLADTSYDTDSAKVEDALKVAISDFTLHNAIGVGELENLVRETIEKDVAGVSVLAKAQSFDRKADTCDVTVTVTCGDVSKTETKTVNLINKDFTLETLGAQIRDASGEGETKIEQGLRFGTKFAYDEEFYGEDVTFGTLLLPKNYFNSAYSFEKVALTPANWTGNKERTYKLYDNDGNPVTGDDGNQKEAKIRDAAIEPESKLAYEYGTYKIFTAVLTKIKEADESTVIIARPYVTYKVDGTEYTYYGDKIERSVAQVEAAIAAGKADKVVTEDANWSNTTND